MHNIILAVPILNHSKAIVKLFFSLIELIKKKTKPILCKAYYDNDEVTSHIQPVLSVWVKQMIKTDKCDMTTNCVVCKEMQTRTS